MRTFCLSLHAGYACRHSGACCHAWSVPAEPSVIQVVQSRQIRRDAAGALFVQSGSERGAWHVARDADGRCVFFDRDAGRLCAIHRDAGPAALPAACRHFPRTILRDPRGTFISLSHFCPTAASLLLGDDPLTIVDARAPLRLDDPIEGLDATGALPPLVRPGVLSDPDGYGAWEQACVAAFAQRGINHEQALNVVAAATDRIRGWNPGTCSLRDAVVWAFSDLAARDGTLAGFDGRSAGGFARRSATPALHRGLPDPYDADDERAQSQTIDALASLFDGSPPPELARIDHFDRTWAHLVAPSFDRFETPMKNYMAARVFANWIAYQGRGLRTIVEWLRTCAAVVRHYLLRRAIQAGCPPSIDDFVEAVRMADLLLLHTIDTQAFARRCAAAEGPDPR